MLSPTQIVENPNPSRMRVVPYINYEFHYEIYEGLILSTTCHDHPWPNKVRTDFASRCALRGARRNNALRWPYAGATWRFHNLQQLKQRSEFNWGNLRISQTQFPFTKYKPTECDFAKMTSKWRISYTFRRHLFCLPLVKRCFKATAAWNRTSKPSRVGSVTKTGLIAKLLDLITCRVPSKNRSDSLRQQFLAVISSPGSDKEC